MFNELYELKRIEIDLERGIFKVNGEDFGEGCTGLYIDCDTGRVETYKVYVEIKNRTRFEGAFDFHGKKSLRMSNDGETDE